MPDSPQPPDSTPMRTKVVAGVTKEGLAAKEVKLSAEERRALEEEARFLITEKRYADAFMKLLLLQGSDEWIEKQMGTLVRFVGGTETEDRALAAIRDRTLELLRGTLNEQARVYQHALLRHATGGAILGLWLDDVVEKESLLRYLTATRSLFGEYLTVENLATEDLRRGSKADYLLDMLGLRGKKDAIGSFIKLVKKRHNALFKEVKVSVAAVRKQFRENPRPDGLGPLLTPGASLHYTIDNLLEAIALIDSERPGTLSPPTEEEE